MGRPTAGGEVQRSDRGHVHILRLFGVANKRKEQSPVCVCVCVCVCVVCFKMMLSMCTTTGTCGWACPVSNDSSSSGTELLNLTRLSGSTNSWRIPSTNRKSSFDESLFRGWKKQKESLKFEICDQPNVFKTINNELCAMGDPPKYSLIDDLLNRNVMGDPPDVLLCM